MHKKLDMFCTKMTPWNGFLERDEFFFTFLKPRIVIIFPLEHSTSIEDVESFAELLRQKVVSPTILYSVVMYICANVFLYIQIACTCMLYCVLCWLQLLFEL